MSRMNKGVTLTEILIATVIMTLVSIPVIGLFMTSKQSISRTDTRREKRYFLNEMLGRAQKHSLHVLWRYFGPYYAGGLDNECGWMRNDIALVDGSGRLLPRPDNVGLQPNGAKDPNPLGFTQDFMDDLKYANYEARVRFEFYKRSDLQCDPPAFQSGEKVAKVKPGPYGVHHLQAGIITLGVRSKDPNDDQTPEIWSVPIMCPAIVGRPGLKMEGCPALSEDYRDEVGNKFNFHEVYGSLVARRESDPTSRPLFE